MTTFPKPSQTLPKGQPAGAGHRSRRREWLRSPCRPCGRPARGCPRGRGPQPGLCKAMDRHPRDFPRLATRARGFTSAPLLLERRRLPFVRQFRQRCAPIAFSNPRMILKWVWTGEGTGWVVISFLAGSGLGLSRGGGGVRGRGKLSKVAPSSQRWGELPSPPPIPAEIGTVRSRWPQQGFTSGSGTAPAVSF